ncbi:hypothetical protein ACMXYO_05735 [Neptuniibacter sp. QD37_6]|uniref:hypothetical protein n=1 Tax=Neptuniibacter sp. QD37_6 TaxID=3398210 RepID=UPI0039F580A9
MNTNLYPQCLRELLDSEVFGEAASLALYEVAKNSTDKYKFGTLLQLETETKARLRPFLYRYHIDLYEEIDEAQILGFVELYLQSSWEQFIATFKPMVMQYLKRFKEIAELGPDQDREILLSMVEHETAILTWLDLELEGQEGRSLDAIIAQINYPLQRPKLRTENAIHLN